MGIEGCAVRAVRVEMPSRCVPGKVTGERLVGMMSDYWRRQGAETFKAVVRPDGGIMSNLEGGLPPGFRGGRAS